MEEAPRIISLKVTDSTNDEARRRLPELANLSVVSASRQTAGRGQGDHSWCSAPGANLTFTLVLKSPPCPEIRTGEIILLTQAVTHGIREYLLSRGVEARIKWPNDLWVGERKICGILIENILDGKRVAASLVGIGLNLNQLRFPAGLPNPVSLRQLTGIRYDVADEFAALYASLKTSAALLGTQEGRTLLSEYFGACVFRLPD